VVSLIIKESITLGRSSEKERDVEVSGIKKNRPRIEEVVVLEERHDVVRRNSENIKIMSCDNKMFPAQSELEERQENKGD
jgi:hypothetical protein